MSKKRTTKQNPLSRKTVRKRLLLETMEDRILCSATVAPAAVDPKEAVAATAAAETPLPVPTAITPVAVATTAAPQAPARPAAAPQGASASLPSDTTQLTDAQRQAIQDVVRDSTNQIWFEQNVGQFSAGVRYGFKTQFGAMLVYDDHLTIVTRQIDPATGKDAGTHSVDISFTGGSPWQIVQGGASGVLGSYQQSDGTALTPELSKEITLRNVYSGVDLRLYSAQNGVLEFDWIVAHAQDYAQIRIAATGQDGIIFNGDGSATFDLRYNDLTMKMPETYQVIDGVKHQLGARMVAGEKPGEIRYELTGNIVADQPLVIDPNVAWSTYFELNDPAFDSYLYAIAINANGVYCAGWTAEIINNGSFGNYMQVNAGFAQGSGTNTAGQNYIYRFNTSGTAITAWTATGIVGSSGNTPPTDMELFPDGRVLVSYSNGRVQIYSADLATKPFDSLTPIATSISTINSVAIVSDTVFYIGGLITAANNALVPVASTLDSTFAGTSEGIIVRYTLAGAVATANWATYVGGANTENFTAIALTPDMSKLVFAVHSVEQGTTLAADAYPTLVNAVDSTPDTVALRTEILTGVINEQVAKPAAFDVFSLLGGSGTEGLTGASNSGSVVVTAKNGGYWVGGNTASTDLPGTTGGAQATNGGGTNDAFLSYIPINGSAGVGFQSTYIGGIGAEIMGGIAYDPVRLRVFAFGTTTGSFPVQDTTPTSLYYDNTFGGGAVGDIFISTFNEALTVKDYATYVGGTFNDYLGDTGLLRGQGHVAYSSATDQVYLATTVHSNLPTTVIGPSIPGFDTTRSNPESASADAHVIFAFNISIFDHGDAPASYEAGTPAADGISALIRLGATVDAEAFALSGAAATGDDLKNSGAANDEDGVATLSSIYTSDSTYSVTVSVFNNLLDGLSRPLNGWIDFNGDGVFTANERASVSVPNSAAQQSVTLTWASLPGIVSGQSYLRLRFSETAVLDNVGTPLIDESSIGTNNVATGHGEIEDYALTINALSSLSGFVYSELNANGTKDAFEGGIPGATVTLTGTNIRGTPVSVITTTDAAGFYTFGNLLPSNGAGYTITETQPADYADGVDTIGSQGGTAGNDVLSAIVISNGALGAGVNGINNNFGETPANFTLTKSLQTTSVAGTVSPNVAVGETATFRLVVSVPAGTFTDFQIQDALPVGYQYVNGSAVVSLVSSAGQLTSSTLSGAGLAQTSIGTPTFGMPGPAVSDNSTTDSDAYASGTDVFFKLGNLTNLETTAAVESVVIEFQAVVLNEAGNQAATSLPNTFTALFEKNGVAGPETHGVASNSVSTTVVEPVLGVTKAVAVSGTDAGDAVQYTITITNPIANAATAYDINVLDVLASTLTFGSVSAAGASIITNTTVGNNLNIVLDSLAAGSSATVTINATVASTASAGSTVGNTTNITWTSTPGANANERTGGGGLNDYSGSASSGNFVLARPTVDKLTPADTTYSVGETVTYDILVTLPEGVTTGLAVTDNLPAGLDFVIAVVQTAAGGVLANAFNGTVPAFAQSNVGNSYTFTFGNTTTNADNVSNNNSFLVRVTARVANVVGNQNAVTLTNTATLAYNDGTLGATTVNDPTPNVNVTVVEPILTLAKTNVGASTGLDAGDTVQFQIVITNTGTATANEVLLSDALPAGLLITTINSTTTAGGATVDVATGGTGTANLTGEYTIPVGGSITVLYTATLQTSVTPNTSFTNTATVIFSSVDGTALGQGTATGERVGTPPNILGDGSLNDYRLQDAAVISTGGVLTVAKGVNNATPSIGDVLTYTVTLTLNEGTTNGIVVTDTLPASGDLQFVPGSAAVSFGTAGSSISGSTIPAISGGGSNILTFTLGNAAVPAGAGANTVVLTYQVLVRNVATNQAGDVESNSAHVVATGLATPPDSSTSVTLQEPALTVSKVLVTPGTDAGDAAQYTITITNSGAANTGTAYDISVLDALDTDILLNNVTLGSGIVVSGAAVSANTSTTSNLNLILASLAPGASATITLNATVAAGAPAGSTVTNGTTVTWTSTPGANANERTGGGGINDYTGSATSANFVLARPTVDKLTPADTTYSVGETVTYDILVTLPEGVTTGLAVTDNLPAGLDFVIAAVQTAAGGALANTFGGPPPAFIQSNIGNSYTFTFGDTTVTGDNDATNNSFLVRVTARIANVIGNQNAVTLTNTATLAYNDGTLGATTVNDPTPNVNITVVEPALTLDKSVVGASTGFDAGDTAQFQIVITNTGTATANEVLLSDALPAGLLVTTINSTTPAGGATVDTATAGTGTATLTGEYTIPVGGSITILYTATLQNSVTPNTSFTNTATVTFSSVDGTALGQGTATGERVGTPPNIQGDGSLNDYRLQDTAQISTGGVLAVAKGVNNATPVIGDVLTYNVTLTLNEGTTNGIVVTDTLPASGDLQFVPGSAAVSFGTVGSSISGSTVPVISGGTGNILTFTLGTAVIPTGAGANTVVLTYQVLVTNVLTNQAGDVETNNATVVATGLVSPPPGTTSVTLREPTLTFSKNATTGGPVGAGDPVTYTLTFTNPAGANAANAFDALVRDTMPADILITSIDGTTLLGGATADSVAAITGGGTGLSGQFDVPIGGSVTITYTGTLQASAAAGTAQTNNAELTWTSLNGGTSLAHDGDERYGAPLAIFGDGSVNDYRRIGSQTITVATATFDKQLFGTSDAATGGSSVAIGENVTYALVVNVPAGTAPSLSIVDTLPVGLQYVPGSVSIVTTVVGSNGLLTANFNGTVPAPVVTGGASDGDDVNIDFGAIIANADGNPANNTFLVLLTVRVTDIPANEGILPGQTALPNTAQFDIPGDGVPPFTPPPVTVTVIEPVLAIDKTFSVASADAGDTVQISIVVDNTGNGPAHDVLVTDVVNLAKFGSITAVTTPAGFTFNNAAGTVTFSGGTIAAGTSATFVFSVVLADGVNPSEVLSNTASAAASSQPGVVPGERSYGPVVDTATLPVPAVFTITKGITSPVGGTVQIGDTVTYSVNVTLVEGTTQNISLIDTLPAGMTYVPASAVVSNANGMTVNGFTANIAGNVLTIAATSVVNPGNVDNAAATDSDTFTITYQAVVNDVVGNAAGTLLTNSLTGTGTGVPPSTPPPATTTVTEPQLKVTKAADDATPDLGQTVHFTLTIQNLAVANGGDAFDILVRDALPAGLSGIANITVIGAGIDTNASTGTLLDLKLDQLALGAVATVEFDAVVSTAAAFAGASIDNNARVYWDTQPGESPNSVLTGLPDGDIDRDYGATGADEVFNADTQDAQDTERLVVNGNTISGVVYADADASGTLNGVEAGVGVGVQVTLSGLTFFGAPYSQTVTADPVTGIYTFANVPRSDVSGYTITEVQPGGFVDGIETAGTLGGTTNNALGADVITGVVVPAGSSSGTGYHFGELLGSGISGFTYLDLNNDGTKQIGEAGLGTALPGTLTGTDAFGQAVTLSGTSDATTGAYSFTGLRPSNGAGYTITENDAAVVPGTYFDGIDTPGSLLGTVVGAGPKFDAITVSVAQNQAGTGYDFGEINKASLSGSVYADLNNNGSFDAFERGVPGVTVTLTGTDDQGTPVSLTVTTNAGGLYSFANIRPSNGTGYTITETQPADYADGADTIGTPGGNATVNDVFSAVVLTAGASGTGNNFGEQPNFTLTKTLVATSEAGTAGNSVAVGEVATFRLVVTIPAGSLTDFQVRDLLPSGYVYVNGSARAGLVGAVASSTVAAPLAGIGSTPVYTLLDADVSDNAATNSDGYVSGTDVFFKFGNLVNPDATAAVEAIVIEFDARVVNEITNTAGTTLTNSFGILYERDGAPGPDPDPNPLPPPPVTTTVVSPVLTFAKSADITTNVDAGDVITYTLTITNPGGVNGSTAFDALVADTMPANLLVTGITSTTLLGGASADSAAAITGGGAGLGGQFDIPAGGSVTIVYTATVQVGFPTNGSVTNAAVLTWTSLNGGNSTAPDAFERYGDPASTFGDGSLNDFRRTTGVTTTGAGPTFSKTLFATSDATTPGNAVTIGETVTYALLVTLPEGTTGSFNVLDTLPPGLRYVGATIETVAGPGNPLTANFGGTVPAPVTTGGVADGDDVNFAFGAITTNADNVTTNNTFVILITAVVTDVPANSGVTPQTTLPNSATFDGPGIPPFTPPPPTVTVSEPRLVITKGVDDPTADLGQVLTYTLTINHTAGSTATAYDLILRDAIPAGFTLNTGSIAIAGGVIATDTSTASQLALTIDQFAVGGTITITYTATVGTAAALGGTIQDNNVRLYWDTTPADTGTNTVLNGGTDGDEDRDFGATPLYIEAPTPGIDDPAQDTVRVTVNGNTISGVVYADSDASGTLNGAEAGVGAGVQVTLSGFTFFGAPYSQTVTADPVTGIYTFTNVPRSDVSGYTITEVQPGGFVDGAETAGAPFGGTVSDALGSNTISGIVIPVGNNSGSGYNFGEVLPSSLSGIVYSDANNDGFVQITETLLDGVPVDITGIDFLGQAVSISTTTVGGAYSAANLRPGNYTITETQPLGFFDGRETVGSQGSGTVNNTADSNTISAIVLTQGVNGAGNNFGELAPAALSGIVFDDRNNDGNVDPGESGIFNVTVVLSGTDDRGNPVNATLTTLADGTYSFANLRPGTYTITETTPAGFLDGIDTAGTLSGSTAVNDVISGIVLGAGQSGANNRFGELTPASLSGVVFSDLNNNGAQNPGEAGVGGVTVTLSGTDDLSNPVSATTVTLGDGSYSFGTLRPGTYTITETQPGTFLDGIDTAGTLGGSNAVNDVISAISVAPAQNGTGYTFAELVPSSLNGFVFIDTDNDGIFDLTESGQGGVTVALTGTDDLGNAVNLTTTTLGDGSYGFLGLRPSNGAGYTVTETQPGGLLDGKNAVGTAGGTTVNNPPSDVISGVVLLNASTTAAGYNFGELQPATISGLVFQDFNLDGSFNGPDSGLIGVTVTLTGTDDLGGTVNVVTTTNGAGVYSFGTLRPGTYVVSETQPAGYDDGNETVGNAGGFLAANDVIGGITVGSGTSATGYTFAEIFPFDPAKTIASTSNPGTAGANLSIGEVVRYHLIVSLPDGTLPSTVLQDLLPAGLVFLNDGTATVSLVSLSGSAVTSSTLAGPGLGGTDSAAAPTFVLPGSAISSNLLSDVDAYGSGTDVYFKLGNLTNTETNVPRGEYAVIEFNARVENIPANRLGTPLDNTFRLLFDLNADGTPDVPPVDIVSNPAQAAVAEPILFLDKQLVSGSTTPAQNDILTFTVTIGHATGSNATAWETVFSDLLPKGLQLESITTSASGGAVITQAATSDANGALSGQFDIPVGGQIVITYRVKVTAAAGNGGTLVNAADVTWTSLPGDSPVERRSGDGLYGGGGLNDSEQRDEVRLKPFTFAFDGFHNFSKDRSNLEDYRVHSPDIFRLPLLPLAPIYSGEADPGSTLVLSLYNANGDMIGTQTVIVDSGGNWLATFPTTVIRDYPNSVQITQSSAFYSLSDRVGHNLRTYFSPALSAGHFFFEELKDIREGEAAPLLGDLGMSNPLSLGAVKYGGELLGSQGAPGGY